MMITAVNVAKVLHTQIKILAELIIKYKLKKKKQII
jgi:hypothetical protein